MITELQRIKGDLLDARSLHKEQLSFIGDQLELISHCVRSGRTTHLEGGIEILKFYVDEFCEHLTRLTDDARKEWEKEKGEAVNND